MRSDVKPTDDNFKAMHELMEGVTVWTPDWAAGARRTSRRTSSRWHEATGS